MKWFVGLLLAILVVLQIQLWVLPDGARATWQLRQSIKQQQEENQQLQMQNDVLAAEIEDLRNGLDAIEEHARTDLGMIRKDETFVQIIKDDQASR